jgi:hypothetical protein
MIFELNGVALVLIIALGVQVVILLFLFGKRQIHRFTLKSRKGPHVPIGYGASRVSFVVIAESLHLPTSSTIDRSMVHFRKYMHFSTVSAKVGRELARLWDNLLD